MSDRIKYIASTIVRTTDLALNGNLFGGTLLRWLDEYGALFTYKYLHHIFVTYKMGNTYFLKSAKLGDCIDFYVANVKYGKLSVTFDLIAKTNAKPQKQIVNTNMTFVAIDINTQKPSLINPQLFDILQFKDCIFQKTSFKPQSVSLQKFNQFEYKAKYIAMTYKQKLNDDAQAITMIQKDWGKIFTPPFITEIIKQINLGNQNV